MPIEMLQKLPTGKFSPPRYHPERHLLRNRIIDSLSLSDRHCRSIIIEGQPGQGKSQLAAQYLYTHGKQFSWVQLGEEERDPVVLLIEILVTLKTSLPDFRSPKFESWLRAGNQLPEQTSEITTILLKDLKQHLEEDFYLVFDDLHLLRGYPKSLQLITDLLSEAGQKFHIMLISRQPVLGNLIVPEEPFKATVLKNEDISLNRLEIAELYNNFLGIPVSSTMVDSLYEKNEGWIMGLIIASRQLSSEHDPPNIQKTVNFNNFSHYFNEEVLNRLPEKLRNYLPYLALLEEIPINLAKLVTQDPDIEKMLVSLENSHLFTRRLDQEQAIYSLHHLFRESLQQVAQQRFGINEIRKVWSQAGQWYSETIPEKALSYFLKAGNYEAAQAILSQIGMDMLAENRVVTLQAFLSRVDEKDFDLFPWLAFFNGIICLNTSPTSARSFLEIALNGFSRDQNEIGELSALTQLVYFHAAVDCQFIQGQQRLERGIELYGKHRHALNIIQQIHGANVFVIGLILFSADFERARDLAKFGLDIAKNLDLKGLEAEARMARCYRDLFSGHLFSCRQEVEHSLPLLQHPQVSIVNKAALQLAHLNLLANEGKRAELEYHLRRYRQRYGDDLIDGSSFGAIINMWHLDLALAEGDHSKVLEVSEAALKSDLGNSLPHMRSLYLQYQGYSLSAQGLSAQAEKALEESYCLRRQAGGHDFIIMNNLVLGAAWAQSGDSDKALSLINEAIEMSLSSGECFIRPGLYAHRARICFRQGDHRQAGRDIENMFSCLQKTSFYSFYGWTPETMTEVLTYAARHHINPPFVRELSSKRLGIAFDEKGIPVPLLRIRSLGTIEIEGFNGRKISTSDLSPSMRHILALLIAAPRQEVLQEDIQTALWPDSPPARSRSSFDNLLSRLRKILSKLADSNTARAYLNLQNGTLSLENCHFDFIEFTHLASKGNNHLRKKEYWQADLSFFSALQIWKGEFLPGMPLDSQGELLSHNLHLLYLDSSSAWFDLLLQQGQPDEAISVATHALLIEPTHEGLVRKLYNLHISNGQHVAARKTLRTYTDALARDGFSVQETGQIMESFWSSQS